MNIYALNDFMIEAVFSKSMFDDDIVLRKKDRDTLEKYLKKHTNSSLKLIGLKHKVSIAEVRSFLELKEDKIKNPEIWK